MSVLGLALDPELLSLRISALCPKGSTRLSRPQTSEAVQLILQFLSRAFLHLQEPQEHEFQDTIWFVQIAVKISVLLQLELRILHAEFLKETEGNADLVLARNYWEIYCKELLRICKMVKADPRNLLLDIAMPNYQIGISHLQVMQLVVQSFSKSPPPIQEVFMGEIDFVVETLGSFVQQNYGEFEQILRTKFALGEYLFLNGNFSTAHVFLQECAYSIEYFGDPVAERIPGFVRACEAFRNYVSGDIDLKAICKSRLPSEFWKQSFELNPIEALVFDSVYTSNSSKDCYFSLAFRLHILRKIKEPFLRNSFFASTVLHSCIEIEASENLVLLLKIYKDNTNIDLWIPQLAKFLDLAYSLTMSEFENLDESLLKKFQALILNLSRFFNSDSSIYGDTMDKFRSFFKSDSQFLLMIKMANGGSKTKVLDEMEVDQCSKFDLQNGFDESSLFVMNSCLLNSEPLPEFVNQIIRILQKKSSRDLHQTKDEILSLKSKVLTNNENAEWNKNLTLYISDTIILLLDWHSEFQYTLSHVGPDESNYFFNFSKAKFNVISNSFLMFRLGRVDDVYPKPEILRMSLLKIVSSCVPLLHSVCVFFLTALELSEDITISLFPYFSISNKFRFKFPYPLSSFDRFEVFDLISNILSTTTECLPSELLVGNALISRQLQNHGQFLCFILSSVSQDVASSTRGFVDAIHLDIALFKDNSLQEMFLESLIICEKHIEAIALCQYFPEVRYSIAISLIGKHLHSLNPEEIRLIWDAKLLEYLLYMFNVLKQTNPGFNVHSKATLLRLRDPLLNLEPEGFSKFFKDSKVKFVMHLRRKMLK